jgi:CRP-like cAMP-binding protein
MSTATTHPTVAELRRVDLFAELSDDQLGEWAQAATVLEAHPGDRIAEYGEPSNGLTLLLEGRLAMLVRDGDVEDRTGFQDAPTWIGAIPTLLETPAPITMRAETDIRYAIVPPEPFVDLTLTHRPVFRRVMSQVKPVIGRIAQREQQRE